jgi:hypothetical protein
MGCVPVAIGDDTALPFSSLLNYSLFIIQIEEKNVDRLDEILLSVPHQR